MKAGIVGQPKDYRWSSCPLYINPGTNESSHVNGEFILSMFSPIRSRAIELFKEYTNGENDDSFIEYQESGKQEKPILSEQEAGIVISDYLNGYGLCLEDLKAPINVKLRHDLIVQLKGGTSLSVRQMARILGIDRNIVQRTK